MAINKVVYGNNTLVDLTEDTVTPETLAKGVIAHSANGSQIVGTADLSVQGATIELMNNTGSLISKGSVVIGIMPETNDEPYIFMQLASDTDPGPYYILEDDCNDGETCQCSYLPGSITYILCGTGAIEPGMILYVDVDSLGICSGRTGMTSVIAEALEAKESGEAGLVKSRIVNLPGISVINNSESTVVYGTVFSMDSQNDGSTVPLVTTAKKGKQPFGVMGNPLTFPRARDGGAMFLNYRPGDTVYVSTDTNSEIQIGDWLVPSYSNPGNVVSGNGYGIGYALEAKQSGVYKRIKCLLNPGVYGITPRCWYLPSGITEDQVLAAYQFVNMPSEADALININNGTKYQLMKGSDSIIWASEKGFHFPATAAANQLQNDELFSLTETDLYSAVFGFSGIDIDTNNRVAVGIQGGVYRNMSVRSYGYNASYLNYPAINLNSSSYKAYRSAEKYVNGVLGGNWKSDASEMYYNGLSISLTQSNTDMGHSMSLAGRGIGNYSNVNHVAGYITACVLFSTILTAEQHLELYQNIYALGGI